MVAVTVLVGEQVEFRVERDRQPAFPELCVGRDDQAAFDLAVAKIMARGGYLHERVDCRFDRRSLPGEVIFRPNEHVAEAGFMIMPRASARACDFYRGQTELDVRPIADPELDQ